MSRGKKGKKQKSLINSSAMFVYSGSHAECVIAPVRS